MSETYYTECLDASFRVKPENFELMLLAIYDLTQNVKEIGWADSEEITRSIENRHVFGLAKTVQSVFVELGCNITLSEEDGITEFDFEREKFSDEELWFSAIAEFVEEGSYIIFSLDGVWAVRFDFTGDDLITTRGKYQIEWED